jgi:hypothetical protein
MQYFSIQNLDIPCVFITGLSYAKTAETAQTSRGYNRFQRLGAAEISLRVNVTRPACEVAGESFEQWSARLTDGVASVPTAPTNAYLAGNPLYADLLFAITAITRTNVYDELGDLVSFECDLTISGVSLAKEASRTKALIFTADDVIQLPDVTVRANGKTLDIDDKTVLSAFTMTERGCDVSISFLDGSKVLSRSALTDIMNDSDSLISVADYGDFHIILADLIDETLHLQCSIFPVEWNRYETWTKSNVRLSDIFDGWNDDTGYILDYIQCRGTRISLLDRLVDSLGLMVDYSNKTFHTTPSALASNTDYQAYVDEDSQTEQITGLVWCDGIHQHNAGNTDGAVMQIDSACVVSDSTVADKCLQYARFMQNTVKISVPYDSRIHQFSVINVVKNATQFPAMVTHFDVDFMTNEMMLELNYGE